MSLINQFAEYAAAPCYTSPEQYLWWAGLSLVSNVAGRDVWTFLRGGEDKQDRLYPNMYIVLLGIPGTGKSSPIDEVRRFLTKLSLDVSPDSFTVQALAKLPRNEEKVYRILPRSFSTLLTENSSQILKTFLCEGYDCAPSYSRATEARGKENISDLCITMLSAATPSHLNLCFKHGDWQEGLPSRFIYVWGERLEKRREETPRNRELESKILDGLMLLQTLSETNQAVIWSQEAKEARYAWADEAALSQPVHMNVEGYWSRREVSLAKIATCIALSNLRWEILKEDWELAVQKLIETESLIKIALGATATNPYFQATQWLIKWLQTMNRPVTEAEIRHQMSWSFHPRDIESVLTNLFAQGILCEEQTSNPNQIRKFVYRPKKEDGEIVTLKPRLSNTSMERPTSEAIPVPL